MKYSCDHCPYETDKKANYLRHINRKFRCYHVDPCDLNGNPSDSNGNPSDSNGNPCDLNGNPIGAQWIDIDIKYVRCVKCEKQVTKRCIKKHLDVCRGVPKNTCKFCFRSFNKHQGCSKHKKICKWNPLNIDDDDNVTECSLLDNQVSEPTIINNTNNSNNDNSHSHSHNTNNISIKVDNNNFAYNYLGSEDVSYIANKPNVLQTLKSYGKKGIYGVGEIINSIICNPEHPENSTLLKPKEYGTDVLVRDCNDANKLEFRDISDAMETIKNKALPRYLQGVCNYIKNNNITRLPDMKEKALLRKLIHIMIVLDIDVPEELEHIVDIDDDKVDQDRSDEALCSSHNTKLNKSVARSAYEFTKQKYKRKDGTYVMKT